MFLPNTQIFKDIRREAIDEISEIAVEERHEIGSVLFFAGEPAVNFYILVEGVVGLAIGEEATSHYTVDKIGESFGWSSLVGRPSYSAKAECLAPTTVLRIDSVDLDKVSTHTLGAEECFIDGWLKRSAKDGWIFTASYFRKCSGIGTFHMDPVRSWAPVNTNPDGDG